MMTTLGLTSWWLRFDEIIPCIVANTRDCKKRREGVMVKGAECNHREFYSSCICQGTPVGCLVSH